MDIAINYWAILAAVIANMAIGTLWYGPVFGSYWMKLAGLTKEGMRTMALKPWQAILGGAVTAFLLAYVLAHVANAFQASDVTGALTLAFWVWIGFTAVTLAEPFLWEGKPYQLFALNAARSLLTLVVMSLIIVLWA